MGTFHGGEGEEHGRDKTYGYKDTRDKGSCGGGGHVLNNGVPYVGAERKRGQGRQVCLASPRRPALCPPQIKG